MNAEQRGDTAPAAGLLEGLRAWASRNPATQRLVSEAEQYAQAKGEQLLRGAGQRMVGAIERAGGGSPMDAAAKEAAGSFVKGGSPARAVLSGATGAVKSAFGRNGQDDGGGKKAKGQRRSTNIIEDIDVGVPVSVAYNQWTQFQEFSDFMKGVEAVDPNDEVKSNWRLKIGPSRRSWEGQITEQIPDRRIAWTSHGAKGSTQGVVTFHPLADDLTRVIVVMEYTPAGPVEKVGDMMRLQLRRVRLDLREYKKFIGMRNQETGAWRGEIRDGEVVSAEQEQEEEGEEEGSVEREEEEGPEDREGEETGQPEQVPSAAGSSAEAFEEEGGAAGEESEASRQATGQRQAGERGQQGRPASSRR